jgi:hypothetical protein
MSYAIWNPATYYVPNDIVDYEGQLYVASGLQPNLNQTPDPAGTDYWGIVGGGNPTPLPSGVQSVTANGPASGVITGGSPSNVTLGVYEWPFLQMSSIRNAITLPATVGTIATPGAVLSISNSSPPTRLFTATFPPSLAGGGGGYTNALFTVTFSSALTLSLTTAAAASYAIQIFPWIGSSPPTAGTTNNFSQCSSPIVFSPRSSGASTSIALNQPQSFTVTLNNTGNAFQTVSWYAVNTTTLVNTGWLTQAVGTAPAIQWSGLAWNGPNTVLG